MAGRAGHRCRRARGSRCAGLCSASRAGRRERPPDVVSPLMLALTTIDGIFSRCSRCSQQGHPTTAACQPVFGRQAVADHQHMRRRGAALCAGRCRARRRRPARAGYSAAQRAPRRARDLEDQHVGTHHRRSRYHQAGGRLHRDADHTPRHRLRAAPRRNRWPSSVPRVRARARCCRSSPGWIRRPAGSVVLAGTDLFTLDEDARAARARAARSASCSRASSCWAT